MRCGQGHEHSSIAEVKACYGLPADLEVREANLIPAGPAPANPRSKEIAQKKAADALNRELAMQGKPHGFTPRCAYCVSGVGDPAKAHGNGMHPGIERDDFQMDATEAMVYDETPPLPPEPFPAFPAPQGRPNKYGGTCFLCTQWVRAGEGLLGNKTAPGKWNVQHLPGQCPQPDPAKQSADGNPEGYGDPVQNRWQRDEARAAERQPLPDVPEGHYAIPSLTGNNDLDFFRVDRPDEGTWKGKTYIKRVIGGHPDKNIRFSQYRTVLQAILDFGVEKAAFAYADNLGRCYKCNRHLTDDESRARRMGPDCATK